MEVSLADLPDWIDLAKYLAEPSQSVQKWQLVGAPEKLILSGAAAIRYTLASRSEKDKLTKEVTAFRRGDRTYFFTGVFRPGDERARDAVRQAVASVMWKE